MFDPKRLSPGQLAMLYSQPGIYACEAIIARAMGECKMDVT